MAVFKDADQFYDCVGALMDLAKMDPNVGPKIAKSGLVIQFKYTDPDAQTTIDARGKPTQSGAYIDVYHGSTDLKPDITMSMKADVSHAFWHGKVNLLNALAKKEIVAEGPIPKILKLLPAVQPLYKEYPRLLKDKGYESLVLK
jgi:hypothetical protein